LDVLITRLHREGIAAGILEVVDGSLGWSDVLECLLRCRNRGTRFRLSCETYHGSGGRFEPIA